jgi:hypothetical protein
MNARYCFLAQMCALPVLACQGDSTGAPVAPLTADVIQFTEWSAPVNLGSAVNAAGIAEQNPTVSKDGLSLFLARGGLGSFDIVVAQRDSREEPWGAAQDVEQAPDLSPDGHRLYLQSTRPGGMGGSDLYVARRHDKRDDFGWGVPVNLGSTVNSSAAEVQPAVVDDDVTGIVTLYFASNRPGGLGGFDIYVSTLLPDETFGPPLLVAEPSSPFDDRLADIRKDALEAIVASDRPGTLGGSDLWVAVRTSTSDPWSAPVNLGPVINTTFLDAGAALSHDGTTLFFHTNANRPGATGPCSGALGPCFFDIYVTTRSKLRDRE